MRKIKTKKIKPKIDKEIQHNLDRPKRPHDNPDRKAIYGRGSSCTHWIEEPEIKKTYSGWMEIHEHL